MSFRILSCSFLVLEKQGGGGRWEQPRQKRAFHIPIRHAGRVLAALQSSGLTSRDLVIGAKSSFPELALSSSGVTVEFKSGSHPSVGLSKVVVWLCLGTVHSAQPIAGGSQGALLIKCIGGCIWFDGLSATSLVAAYLHVRISQYCCSHACVPIELVSSPT